MEGRRGEPGKPWMDAIPTCSRSAGLLLPNSRSCGLVTRQPNAAREVFPVRF